MQQVSPRISVRLSRLHMEQSRRSIWKVAISAKTSVHEPSIDLIQPQNRKTRADIRTVPLKCSSKVAAMLDSLGCTG